MEVHKCGFWKGHRWGQWRILNDGMGTPVIRSHDKSIVGHTFVQQRTCKACGLSEFKAEKVMCV